MENGLSIRDNKKIAELYKKLDIPIEELTAKSESLMSALERKYKDKAGALSYIQKRKKEVSGIIKSSVQQDDMLVDLDLMISIIIEAISESELKRKTDTLLIELERKYEGNPLAEDALIGAIRKLIADRKVELQQQEAGA